MILTTPYIRFQAICNTDYTYKADLELMNITELVTQVIKRNPQSPMSVKFQSAQFIKPLIGTYRVTELNKNSNFQKRKYYESKSTVFGLTIYGILIESSLIMFGLELSFTDLPSPVVTHIISIITVILELSVNNDRYVNLIQIRKNIKF